MGPTSATTIGWLVLGWIAAYLVFIALFLWLWSWILRKERTILPFLMKIGKGITSGILRWPAVQSWSSRHPTFLRIAHARFSAQTFTGLPLTLLIAALLYTLSLLMSIIGDYLFGDPLIAADSRIANLLFAFRDPGLLHLFYGITLFGSSGTIVVASLVLSVVLWQSRQRLFVFSLVFTLLLSEGATLVGKLLFHRARPDLLLHAVTENSFSFPSGHATTAVAFYGFVAYVIFRTTTKWPLKVNAFFCFLIGVFLIDVSRLYLGVHYLSDVLAGNLVGLAGLLFSIAVTEWLISKTGDTPLLSPWKLALVGIVEILMVISLLFFGPSPWLTGRALVPKQIAASAIPSFFTQDHVPHFTETLTGAEQEPTSVMIIASDQCLVAAFNAAHWQLADALSFKSLRKALEAALFNKEDAMAPMTPSFYNSRPHDFGFEKETDTKTVRARHHARFWRTGYITESGTVFVGTVSLDTGIKWGGLTHTIAPAIDTERDLLRANLESANVVASTAIITLMPPGIGENFTGDQFFTDGKAEILFLRSCEPSKLHK